MGAVILGIVAAGIQPHMDVREKLTASISAIVSQKNGEG
jgi:hypothetical protein